MKFVIASDIHGSAFWCRKLMELCEKEQPDHLILLGDILYRGPRNDLPRDYAPKQVIPMLGAWAEKILCVRGNCEAEVDQMVLSFPVLADYALIPTDKNLIFVTHGHNWNNTNLPAIKPGDILLHGHTHIPVCEEFPTHIYINPGSVSIPKENSPHSYMIFEDNTFLWKDLEGETYKTYTIK